MESTTEWDSATTAQDDISTYQEAQFTFPTWKAVHITVVTVSNLLFNSFSIFLICTAKRELQRPDVQLVLSMFVSDFLFGVALVLAVVGAWQPYLLQNEEYFRVYIAMTYVPAVVTVYSLGGIAVVKMLAVTRPLRYRIEVSAGRTNAAIVGMWVVALGLTAPILSGIPFRHYPTLLCGLPLSFAHKTVASLLMTIPGFGSIFYCYAKIFWVVRNTNKKIGDVTFGDPQGKARKVFVQSVRSAKSLFIITVTFLVVYGLGGVMMPLSLGSDVESEYTGQFLLLWSTSTINSSLNSLLYIVLSSKMRQRAASYLRCRMPSEETLTSFPE